MKKFEIEVIDESYMSGVYNTIGDVASILSRTDAFKDISANKIAEKLYFLFDCSGLERELYIKIINNYIKNITVNYNISEEDTLNIKINITEARINDDEIKLNWTINIYYN